MLMTLFKWQAKILNKLYKTERYEKLIQLKLTSPEQINYQYFFQITPDVNASQYTRLIEATNSLCRPSVRAIAMQQEVAYLNEFMKKMAESTIQKGKHLDQAPKQQAIIPEKPQFTLAHVVIYSSLSKCRIWPKILKSGIGFVPNLIQFYNSFTKQNADWLDFKFDPVILTQKYTKIMKKVNLKKRDHPKFVEAVTKNNIEQIKNILSKLEEQYKVKYELTEQSKQKSQNIIGTIINNISHKGLAISHICCRNSSLDTIKFLYQLGTDFEILDDEQQTALFYAVKRSDLEIIKYLVEEIKVDLNHREYQNRTALYLGAFEGDLKIVDYLFKSGANPQMCSKLDRTPLSKACYLGNIKVVQYLLSINVDILKQDNKGRTALHNAAWGIEGGRDGKRRGHIMLEDSPECAELLLKAGHPVDLQDYDGFTPFFSAVSSCAIRSMYLLIKYKANIYHKTKNQQTAVFIAAKYGHLEVLKILINQLKLDFLSPDYHGYSPLCASITLEKSQVFNYLCDLYMQNNVKIDSNLIVACTRQYQTTNNLLFIRQWVKQQANTKQLKSNRAVYLSHILYSLINSLKQLKKQKRNLKSQLANFNQKKKKQYKPKNIEVLEKIEQKEFNKVSQILQKQEEQQTQDHETLNPSTQSKQASVTLVTNIKKQLNTIRKMSDMILEICSEIVIKLEQSIKNYMKSSNIEATEENIQKIKQDVVFEYKKEEYQKIAMFLLSECVFLFNKGIKNVVDIMLELAKIVNSRQPKIAPIYAPEHHQKQYQTNQQQVQPAHQLQQLSKQDQILLQHTLEQSQSLQLHPSQILSLKITPHQSESQLIKLLLNKQVTINLTMDQHKLNNSLFKLAKYRKTAVIIAIFNSKEDVGKVSYDRLLDIASGKQVLAGNMMEGGMSVDGQELSLISFCVLHKLSDILVFLQEVCKSPEIQLQVKIPQYAIQTKNLTADQCNIDLEPAENWIFELDQLFQRMSAKQRQIYKQYLISSQQNTQQKQHVFQTCKSYEIVSTIAQLEKLQKIFEQFILIGIDVEYYEVSKEESFICSIQISNGERVYILDTLSHLYGEDVTERLNPDLIGDFMKRLMKDDRKIKIFHAYENDVKWLHEDYDLGSRKDGKNKMVEIEQHINANVVDTCRIYSLCNTVKKGESAGLRTLCKQYLNYEMDKNFQRSDWRIRPLFKQMIQYAALDAEVLPYIYLKMLVHSQKIDAIGKLKEGFCIKRNMKSRGFRNRLVSKQVKNKLANSN